MIKVLKLQKAVYVIILGIIGLIAYKIMSVNRLDSSIYILKLSGLLFLIGSLWFLYPILLAKRTKEGEVQLDPEKQEEPVESVSSGQS